MKRMAIELSSHHFSVEHLIMIINFLKQFVREANIQEKLAAQELVALPSFLKEFAKSHFEAGAEMVSPEGRGVSTWPEAVQYLLKNYAQLSRISSETADLRAIFHDLMKTQREPATKLNQAIYRCGNVQPLEKVFTLSTTALHHTIQ